MKQNDAARSKIAKHGAKPTPPSPRLRDALRNALTEAGEELRWFLHEANIRGSEGPPRVWRLVRTIEGLLMIDAALAK